MVKYAYDIMDRVTNISWRTTGGATLGGFAYEYDAVGRITSRSHALGDPSQPSSPMSQPSQRTYAYDDFDRLASDGDVAYTYDAAGNRMACAEHGETITYTLGVGDRLASWTGGAYAHDAAGNVTRIERDGRPTLDLTWNSQYQLVSVSTNGVFAEGYAYDALSRRVSTTTLEGTTRHVYDDNWQVIADIDEQGNIIASYVWGEGIDKLLAVAVGGSTYYAHTDIQGTVWGYVDSQNNVVARWQYDAWGNIISEYVAPFATALARLRYRFQGREWSAATGLINFRMRWYDAETGRWLAKDPIGLSGGLNLYALCTDNPLILHDPIGCLSEPLQSFLNEFSRASQGVVNAFTGGLFDPSAGVFYDWFNETWDDLGEESNECNESFNAGMNGGRLGVAFFSAGAFAKAAGLDLWLGSCGLHPPHHGMGKHFEIILRVCRSNNLKIIIPGVRNPIYIGIH